MERKLTKVVDETEITVTEKMCSCGTDVADNLCSWECPDTCGVRSIVVKSTELNTEKGLKIKHFREMEVFFRLSDFCVLGVW